MGLTAPILFTSASPSFTGGVGGGGGGDWRGCQSIIPISFVDFDI